MRELLRQTTEFAGNMNHNLVTNLIGNACLNMKVSFLREGRMVHVGERKYRLTDFDIYSLDHGRVLGVADFSDYEKAKAVVKDYIDALIEG